MSKAGIFRFCNPKRPAQAGVSRRWMCARVCIVFVLMLGDIVAFTSCTRTSRLESPLVPLFDEPTEGAPVRPIYCQGCVVSCTDTSCDYAI